MSEQAPIPTTMRASAFTGPGEISVVECPIPTPGPGELLVKMMWASVCGSDIHMVFDGMHNPAMLAQPGYPGHEGVGVVVGGDVAAVSGSVRLGDAVLTAPIGSEGRCFAEYQIVDAAQVVEIPRGLDLRRALMAQQLGTTVFGLRKFWPLATPPRVAVVQGAGSAGTFFQQLLSLHGCPRVIMSEPLEHRRAVAETLGAWKVVSPDELGDAVREATDGLGADLVIEAAGFDSSRAQAVELVRYAGTVGCFGFPERLGSSPWPAYDSFRKAIDIRWTVGAQLEPGLPAFREAMRLIDRGFVNVDHCLGDIYPLAEVGRALSAARSYTGIKTVLDLSPPA